MNQNPNTPSSWGILLSKLWLSSGQAFPIDPHIIALEISKTKFDDKISAIYGHDISGVEGMLSKSKSKNEWFILFDKTIEIQGRINFTIAHEFGHYLLHRNTQSQFECSQANILAYESAEYRIREKEANEFASYLLMPINDYREQIGGQAITLDLIGHCADRYNVSLTASMLKWVQFTDEVAVIVLARDDFVLWSYPSQKAKKLGIFYPKGYEVPEASRNNLSFSNSSNSVYKMAPGVWHAEWESEESVIFSDKYELAIFMIKFPLADMKTFEDEADFDAYEFMISKIENI